MTDSSETWEHTSITFARMISTNTDLDRRVPSIARRQGALKTSNFRGVSGCYTALVLPCPRTMLIKEPAFLGGRGHISTGRPMMSHAGVS